MKLPFVSILIALFATSVDAQIARQLRESPEAFNRRLQAAAGDSYCCPLSSTDDSCFSLDAQPGCNPFRSKDYCAADESFAKLIKARTNQIRNNVAQTQSDGHWFQELENKVAGYLLSSSLGLPSPELLCCVTNPSDLSACTVTGGIVVKATELHSNAGVFVLPNGFGGKELLREKDSMTLADIIDEYARLGVSNVVVEQFISGATSDSLPTEYKYHMFGEEVGAISVIENRGTPCACYAVVDENWNRLDQYGCFAPGRVATTEGSCAKIDFLGGRRCGPVKRDLPLCASVPQPPQCIKDDMKSIAQQLSAPIGVYMRVDMFLNSNGVYFQEFAPNHMNGIRHCAAKFENGCVNSCFLGQLWKTFSSTPSGSSLYGGVVPASTPNVISEWLAASSDSDKCALLDTNPLSITFQSSCSGPIPPPVPPPPPTPSPIQPTPAPIETKRPTLAPVEVLPPPPTPSGRPTLAPIEQAPPPPPSPTLSPVKLTFSPSQSIHPSAQPSSQPVNPSPPGDTTTRSPTPSPVSPTPSPIQPTPSTTCTRTCSESCPIQPSYSCAWPADTFDYSVITKCDAKISAHNVYNMAAVGGTLLDSTYRNGETLEIGTQATNTKSYFYDATSNMRTLLGDNPVFRVKPPGFLFGLDTCTDFCTEVVDWNHYLYLADNLKERKEIFGSQKTTGIFVFDKNDAKPPRQTDGNGNYIYSLDDMSYKDSNNQVQGQANQGDECGGAVYVFRSDHPSPIVIDKAPSNGRQFCATILAPNQTVFVKGQVGYIDGQIIAKELDDDGQQATSLQYHEGDPLTLKASDCI